MFAKLNFFTLDHFREGAEAEYSIRLADDPGTEFIISLQNVAGGALSPQLHVFEDGLPALLAFTTSGAMAKLMHDVNAPAEFERRLGDAGIWAE